MQISVIVPTRNRARLLAGTLSSLLKQSFAGDVEFLVVDNGSTDETPSVVSNLPDEHGSRVRYISEPVPGLLSGRHRGAKESKGDILVFVDDDIEADTGWLEGVAEAFLDASVSLVGGPSLPTYEAPPPDWMDPLWIENEQGRRCEWLSLIEMGTERKRVHPNMVWGLNLAIRHEALFDLGGFHPDNIPKHLQRFQGDGETGLTRQAAARGFVAVYEPRALVHHVIPVERLTLAYLEARAFYQGVCDSYARIRGQDCAEPTARIAFAARAALAGFSSSLRLGSRASRLRGQLRYAYMRGYSFHQREVAADPELLAWVLRPDYWDYELPGASR